MIDLDEYIVEGYYPTIGIECHVQLKTASKLFGTESNDAREAEPNTLIGHISYGLPGALPVLNKEAVLLASKAAFALGAKPQKFSKFDRKHYFYPDLPKGYQITQFDEPIIIGGKIEVVLDNGSTKVINITRAHIEEDAGKSTHPKGKDYSLVDLNRAGTPLLEIVSEPEIHSAKEAKAYAKELWLRMKYAGVSDVNLFYGNMRFDVNVSVSKVPNKLGSRSETKNLNSFRSVERSVNYEIKRQIKLLNRGKEIAQETRGWQDDLQKTVSQRSKEDANDYRYFPDPDIPPIRLTDKYISDLEKDLPVMPSEWRKKMEKLGLDHLQTESLLESNVEFDSDFLSLITSVDGEQSKVYAKWVINIESPLRRDNSEIAISDVDRFDIYEQVYKLVSEDKLNSNNSKLLLEKLLLQKEVPKEVELYAKECGLIQVSDSGEINNIVDKVISENPKAAEEVKNGETKVVGFLVGQVMKKSMGKANPALVQKILKDKLGG